MADENDRFDGRPYRDTVTLPSILVMPGDPWPADFHACYPNAFHVPVRIVWREGTSARDGVPARHVDPSARIARPGEADGDRGAEPSAEDRVPSLSTQAPVAVADGAPSDPIGAFLRVNDTLNRLYAGVLAEGASSEAIELVATPNEGAPNSWCVNPGSGQMRYYGPDGYPSLDIDSDHDPPGVGSPHMHVLIPIPGEYPARQMPVPVPDGF